MLRIAQKQALADRVERWRTERTMDNDTARALAQGIRELTDENEHLRLRSARLEAALEQIATGLGDVDGHPFYPAEYARKVLDQERPLTAASGG